MNLYIRDLDKVLVDEFKINEEELIKFNKKKILDLYNKDLKNKTSDFLFLKRDNLVKKVEYNNYSKIYYKKEFYSVTYLFPKINQKSNSIYNKFYERYKQKCEIDSFNLDEFPLRNNIDILKNGNGKENLFIFSNDQKNAIKLDYELELLYKLLYLKCFDLNYNKNNSIDKDEFGKIFSLSFKELITVDTYKDLLSKNNHLTDNEIESEFRKDEEIVKKIHMILSKRY